MRRVVVVGVSGSGKSTLADRLSARLDLPRVELDALFHQPGWTEAAPEQFRAAVAEVAARDRWVVDGNYSAVTDVLWPRCDTVVWLDLPRPLVMRQVVRRSLRRVVTRQQLWNGNRETWRGLLDLRSDTSIIGWAWRTHGEYRRRYESAMSDPRWSHARFERLQSHAEAERWLLGQVR